MDTVIQLRQAPSFTAAAAARPVLAVTAAARSWSRKLRARACHGQGQAASSAGKPRAAPARAVAGSELQTSSSTSVQVGATLLLQSFASDPRRLKLSLQLVGATVDGLGDEAEKEIDVGPGETKVDVTLNWDEKLGAPGAVIVKNHSDFEVYLKQLSLTDGRFFVCNGWVYPVDKHPHRIFFTNDAYVTDQTPVGLSKYREAELRVLRGEGASKEKHEQPFQPWDRVYDYDVYNDLGNPDLRPDLARPVLGDSQEYPYPRRTKTSRPKATKDSSVESRAPLDKEIYVPCDERVGTSHSPAPNLGSPGKGGHFQSLENIYPLFGSDMFPVVPRVIAANRENWRKDEEFARQTLAGANPMSIKRVTEFPLVSELEGYGDQNSKITEDHVKKNLGGMTVQQAVKDGKLYVVDHHDWMMPYLKRINELPGDTITVDALASNMSLLARGRL